MSSIHKTSYPYWCLWKPLLQSSRCHCKGRHKYDSIPPLWNLWICTNQSIVNIGEPLFPSFRKYGVLKAVPYLAMIIESRVDDGTGIASKKHCKLDCIPSCSIKRLRWVTMWGVIYRIWFIFFQIEIGSIIRYLFILETCSKTVVDFVCVEW